MGLLRSVENLVDLARRTQLRRIRGPLGEFLRAGGNELLVRDLPIRSSDLVLDAGGFEGAFAAEILTRYGSRVVVLEPVPQLALGLRARFASNDRVEVREEAIGGVDSVANISVAGDSSSLSSARQLGETLEVRVRDSAELLAELLAEGELLGCFKLNIEGSEFDVLERLSERRVLPRVRCLVVQFHPWAERAPERREAIQRQLEHTHRRVFDYPFVWERWDLRT